MTTAENIGGFFSNFFYKPSRVCHLLQSNLKQKLLQRGRRRLSLFDENNVCFVAPFRSADDGSTGFMQGVYVLLSANGSVSWPVPVKLRSSCKVMSQNI